MGTLIYRPGKADEQRWAFDPADPDSDIGYECETATDWPWQIFISRYAMKSHLAMQALVYAYLKRDNDRLKLSSVKVKFSDLDYEPDADEINEPEPDDEPKPKGKKKGKADEPGEG